MNLKHLSLIVFAIAAVPLASQAQTGYAATADSRIFQFDFSSNPGVATNVVNVTGLVGGDGSTPDAFGSLFELAYNPGNGVFYGQDGNANFYSVNVATGQASFISNAFTPMGFDAGLAYDPFGGNFRFVSDAAENVAIETDGTVTTGNPTVYATGDANEAATPFFVGLGIDPDFGTGFALDSNLDTLATTIDPNFETFDTVGGLGLDVTAFGGLTVFSDGFDITIFAALSEDAVTSSLFTIDPFTGAATRIGAFSVDGSPVGVSAIAVPEPATGVFLIGGCAVLASMRRRRA